MEPPAWVCRSLARIHPWVRLAWVGNGNLLPENEEDRGEFAIVQLYHVKDSGPKWAPRTIKELWDVHTVERWPGNFDIERVYRGTLYNKHGRARPDWDPLTRQPVMIAGCDSQFGLSTQSVYDGGIISWLRAQAKPARETIKERVQEARTQGAVLEDRVDQLTGQMADELWHSALKPEETGVDVPKKFIEETPRLAAQRAGVLDFKDEYVKKMPKEVVRESEGT